MLYVYTSCSIIPHIAVHFDLDLNIQVSLMVTMIALWIVRTKLYGSGLNNRNFESESKPT